MKMEFSKKLLILDYLVLGGLLICVPIFQSIDIVAITVAWIAQIGISSGAYYWKAKNENKVKVPMIVIKSLPKEMLDRVDLTQIITSIIDSE